VYVTKQSTLHREGRMLVAILELNQVFGSHAIAGAWYQANGFQRPSNCIVPGNDPVPIHMTNPKMTTGTANFTDSRVWDRAVYVPRARQCVRCFSSSAVYLNLRFPPTVNTKFWIDWLGGDPGQRTQNVGLPLRRDVYDALLKHVGIELD
jgi:hypothetical protein